MTSSRRSALRLNDRGCCGGMKDDITSRPRRACATGHVEKPHQLREGFSSVIVNGQMSSRARRNGADWKGTCRK